jgi:hypothetical protein
MQEVKTSIRTKASAIRKAINVHRTWIERHLRASISEMVILEVDIDLTQIGSEYLLGSENVRDVPTRMLRRLRTFVDNAESPRHFPALLEIATKDGPGDYMDILDGQSDIFIDAKPALQPGIYWGDAPLALHLRVGGVVLIAINIPYFEGPVASHESSAHIVVTKHDRASEVLRVIAQIARQDQQPRIRIQDGPTRPISRCEWEDLILEQSVLTLLRDDFESFYERQDWYRRNRQPHRRGYLFHGEPGNGKTSAIRAMLTSKGLTAYTLRFFDPQTDDNDLERLFDCAVRNRPSLILLEDIDRVFPKTGNSKSNISLQQLLNCLDGVGTGDGIVVVATANEPSLLDPAILKRPGRFDRVVHFARPASELRKRYLIKFGPEIDGDALDNAAAESDGFSYAQLREALILAGQRSFVDRRDTTADDLLFAIRILRETTAQGARNTKSAGFVSRDSAEEMK